MNVCTSRKLANARVGGHSRLGHLLGSYRGNGVSHVVMGSMSHLTEGARRLLIALELLGSFGIYMCFRRRNVSASGLGVRVVMAFPNVTTRRRDIGVSKGVH